MSSSTINLGVPDLLRRARVMRQIHFSRSFPSEGNLAKFAALALEAYPHDLSLLLKLFAKSDGPAQLLAAKTILPQPEDDRVQLKSKYTILYYVLTGKHPPTGERVFQDLFLLIDIRNYLVHFKPTVSKSMSEEMGVHTRRVSHQIH